MFENLLAGACSISLLKLHFPSSQNSDTIKLLNLLLLVVYCANGPVPSQLSHTKEQFPSLSFQWMCCSNFCLFINIFFQVNDSPLFHFLLRGFDLLKYFALKKSSHNVCFVVKSHHCLNWRCLQISIKFLIPQPLYHSGSMVFLWSLTVTLVPLSINLLSLEKFIYKHLDFPEHSKWRG